MKKYVLHHGCIRQDNSIMSRDAGFPETFDTREDAEKALSEHEKFYHSIGYKIWFAEIKEEED